MSEDLDRAAESVGDDRRAFLKKMVVGSAFAVPVVSSFSMAGVQAAFAQTPPLSPGRSGTGGTTSETGATTTTTEGNTTTTTTEGNTTTTTQGNTTTTTQGNTTISIPSL
jgi:hypothetical protein